MIVQNKSGVSPPSSTALCALQMMVAMVRLRGEILMKLKALSMLAIATISMAAGVLARPYFSMAVDPSPRPTQRPGMMQPGNRPMMPSMQMSSEFEFLSQMIPHHEEAIATAQAVLERSDRPEMRTFAQDIIDVQSAEIDQMQTWLGEWYSDQVSSSTYIPMMRDLSSLSGDELDEAFLEDMIRHHMHAVMMSQMLINHGWVEHDPVLPFAEAIASTQRQEIHQMHAWLQDWYGVSGMPHHRVGRQTYRHSPPMHPMRSRRNIGPERSTMP
jgi:uncharacterized protein (DUF305 family)